MTKGKKIGIAVAVILGLIILVSGVFMKPKSGSSSVEPGTYAKNQVEKLNQLQQLTTQIYKDEETTDMVQLKSQITHISGSQESLFNGMIIDLDTAKGAIGKSRYDKISAVLQNNVKPAYQLVITDANEIVKNGYDQNPGQTVENYQNAMKAISNAQNTVSSTQSTASSEN